VFLVRKMTIEDLLRDRRIGRQPPDQVVIRAMIERAGSDLDSAAHMLEQDADWALSIACNAVLRCARALVFARGFRPANHEAHKNTFAFLGEIATHEIEQLVPYFDRVRIKRHRAVYDAEARTTRSEAETLLKHAHTFLRWTERELHVR